MYQFVRPVQITSEAHLIQSFWKEPDAPVGVHFNTMVLASREPVVFDTGVPADETEWLDAVSTVVDPGDVRWIVLSHDDHDHTGNLEAAVEHFPNATVVASWWMTERLVGSIELDPRRMRWVVSGDRLDIGDRTLMFERPPIFDSPTTRAVFDPSTGLFWAGDLGAALGPDAVVHADEMPADELAASFVVAHGWISPWVSMVDDAKYQAAVDRIADLGITTWCRPTDRCTKAATSTGRSNCCARYRPPVSHPSPANPASTRSSPRHSWPPESSDAPSCVGPSTGLAGAAISDGPTA